MTVVVPFRQAVSRQLLPHSTQLLTRLPKTPAARYITITDLGATTKQKSFTTPSICSNSLYARRRVTPLRVWAATRTASATAKTSAKRKATSPSKSTRSTTIRKQSGRKKTAAKKSKAKPKRQAITEAAKQKNAHKKSVQRKRDLKATALLDEPKRLPATSWLVYMQQHLQKGGTLADSAARVKECGRAYHNLSPSEMEQLNHTANENATKNAAEYKRWVTSHTPQQIRDANSARKNLAQLEKKRTTKSRVPARLIKDDRLVARPRTSYNLFYTDRFRSGDFKHMAITEACKLIGSEWRSLNASEKKPYEDGARAERNRYAEEHKTVYGVEAPAFKAGKSD